MGYQINVARFDNYDKAWHHFFRTDYITSRSRMFEVYQELKKAFPMDKVEVTAWSKTGRELTEQELSKE